MSDFEGRFWSKVRKGPTCWVWLGKRRGGYGRAYKDGQYLSAHRVAYALRRGTIPKGMKVLHRCDTPECVRPSHLFLGSQADNMRDCARKGRLAFQVDPSRTQGERHPGSKLSNDLVREIRRRRGERSTYELALEYGVSQATIHQIHVGQTWKHVEEVAPCES